MLVIPQWKATQFPDGGQHCRTSLYRCQWIGPVHRGCHTVNTENVVDMSMVDFCTAVSMPRLTCSLPGASSRCKTLSCTTAVHNSLLGTHIPTESLVSGLAYIPITSRLFLHCISRLSAFDFFSYTENRLSAVSNGPCYEDCWQPFCFSVQDALGGSHLRGLRERHLQGENTLFGRTGWGKAYATGF